MDRLKSAGGLFESSAAAWAPHIVSDGNLFTSQNPASSAARRRLVEVL